MAVRFTYQTILEHWPSQAPLLCLGGVGWEPLIATVFQEVPWTSLASEPCLLHGEKAGLCGTIGLISYDQWAGETVQPAPSRFFRIHEAIKVDPETGLFCLVGSRDVGSCDFALDHETAHRLVAALNRGATTQSSERRPTAETTGNKTDDNISLTPLASSRDYLAAVNRVLEDIRDGRYYQLNLLRYFRVTAPPSKQTLAARLDRLGGPMSAWLAVDGLDVISFSPERFVTAQVAKAEDGSVILETAPIKGTVARSTNPDQDDILKASLDQSTKDWAELAMIVDLMRNDLNRISMPRSVSVQDPGSVQSFSHLHHLVARITSRMDPTLSLRALLSALCPAGSITGAPKQEVTSAIRRYEGRARRYFMGHIFYWNGRGHMNSSILIRTAVAEDGWERLEYAAGSGIVIRSGPESELAEIRTKTRVFADDVLDF